LRVMSGDDNQKIIIRVPRFLLRVKTSSVQDKNLKSWEGKGLIGVSRKPKKPS